MTTIADLVDRASRRFGRATALVDGDRTLSFRDVGDRSNRLANVLLSQAEPGARVALLMSNRLEFVEADFAIAKAGMVKAPLNPRLADEERRFILANCAARVLVTELRERDRVESIRGELPDLVHVVYVDGDYADLLAAASPVPPAVAIDPAQPSMILHTSGTTGRPKGATTTDQARVAATAHMLLDEFSPGPDDGMIHVAPMSHGSGSKILAYYIRGARNITVPKFDPDAFFRSVTELGGTSSFMVPTMIRMLLDAPNRMSFDLSRIRNLTYGGAPMPTALAEEALSTFGPVLTQVYGSCEAPHPVTVLSRREHVVDDASHLGSAGHETFGAEIVIVDEDGSPVPIGEVGEMWVRGPNLMDGYWGDQAATEAVFADSWYKTGDLARRDEDGFIFIAGRVRDMLISGGLNVYPAEVETVLHRHPDVSEAAVFGVPDEMWGEAVTAAIVARSGRLVDEQDILRHCKEYLADYKKPRRILFVDSLPKGNTGKIARSELAALVVADDH